MNENVNSNRNNQNVNNQNRRNEDVFDLMRYTTGFFLAISKYCKDFMMLNQTKGILKLMLGTIITIGTLISFGYSAIILFATFLSAIVYLHEVFFK